jgi:hypothetical protein
MDLALKDRFAVIVNIDHLINSSPSTVERVLREHDEDISFNGKLKIGSGELRAIPVWAKDNVQTDTRDIRALFEVLEKGGYAFSTRFIKRFNGSLKVWALLQGRNEANDKDFADVADLLLSNREDGLDGQAIKNAVEQALSIKQFEPFNKKLNALNRKVGIEFVRGYVDVIHELRAKSEASLPDLIREKRDKLEGKFEVEFRSAHDAVSRDVVLLRKMQSEYFRGFLDELSELNEVETAFLSDEKAKEFVAELKKVDGKGKLFNIQPETIKDEDKVTLSKWTVAPKGNVPESYNRIKALRVKARRFMSRS